MAIKKKVKKPVKKAKKTAKKADKKAVKPKKAATKTSTKKSKGYGAKEITVLEGLEPVRKRPGNQFMTRGEAP